MTKHVLEFYEGLASATKPNESTWGDTYAVDLEIANISSYIKNGDNVLDIGCANGFSTLQNVQVPEDQLRKLIL